MRTTKNVFLLVNTKDKPLLVFYKLTQATFHGYNKLISPLYQENLNTNQTEGFKMEGSYIFLHLLIGPLMLVLSLIFFYFPPKKINLVYGHRTSMSMKNQDTWDEANKKKYPYDALVSAFNLYLTTHWNCF